MGAAGYQLNKQINDTVAYKKAQRPSPSTVQGTGVGYDPVAGRPTELQVSGPNGATYFQGVRAQDYGKGPTYETPDEALANYNKLLDDVNKRVEQTASKYNYNNFDPGDFARAGFSGPSAPAQQAAADKVSDYLIKNKIPPSIEVDGQTLYFTTGFGEDALSGALGAEYKSRGSYEALGPAGTYSTIYKKPESIFSSINPVLRAALGVATGGASEAFISTAKAISGETLHAGDYLNLAVQGYKIANAPPTTAVPQTGSEAIEAGVSLDELSPDQLRELDIIKNYSQPAATASEIADEVADIWGTSLPENPFTFDFDGIPISIVGGGVGGYQGYDDAGREEEVLLPTGYTPETFRDEPEVDPVLEAIEDIVADPFEEDIPTPTLPPVTEEPEEPEEQEQTSGGGGGGGGQEEGAPSQGTGEQRPVEGSGGSDSRGGTYEGIVLTDDQGNTARWEDRILLPSTEVLNQSEGAEWGKTGIWEVVIGGTTYDIDWDNGTYAASEPQEFQEPSDSVESDITDSPEQDQEGDPVQEEEVEDLFILDPWDEWDEGSDPVGGGDIGDIGGTDGTGTTGGGTGSVGDTGTGEGTGTGDGTGTGSGTGTGEGTGTGDGSGDGTGSGSGTGTGSGTGAGVGLGSATRTTDSLFGDMLQLETQVGDTQELLRPFSLAPTPSIMPYNEPQPQLLNQFLQQQQDMQLQYQPQRMLTDSRFPKGYNF